MFSIVYLPGLLAPGFLQLRLGIVISGSGGRIQGVIAFPAPTQRDLYEGFTRFS
jgi:hypothetical protein